jgi:hypothetical protein
LREDEFEGGDRADIAVDDLAAPADDEERANLVLIGVISLLYLAEAKPDQSLNAELLRAGIQRRTYCGTCAGGSASGDCARITGKQEVIKESCVLLCRTNWQYIPGAKRWH